MFSEQASGSWMGDLGWVGGQIDGSTDGWEEDGWEEDGWEEDGWEEDGWEEDG